MMLIQNLNIKMQNHNLKFKQIEVFMFSNFEFCSLNFAFDERSEEHG